MSALRNLLVTFALGLGLGLGLVACRGASSPAAPTATAVVGDHGVQPANLARLTPYVEAAGGGDIQPFSGYVLVAQHDQPIYAHAFGAADRTTGRVATADTTFRVGSLTKQFTAAAILTLAEAGKLSVDDPVSRHLPDYAGPGKDVTIHQLLTHTAGLPEFTALPGIAAKKAERWTTRALLATFWDLPLAFAPGTQFAYSNSNYVVLGAIVESASGMPWATYVERTLFAPAGMTRSSAHDDAAGAPDLALGYQAHDAAVTPADAIDLSMPFAAGAVRTTANDLVKWHRALSGDTILPAAARARLYQAEQNNYAYGWVVQDVAGHHTVWHNGAIDGFRTMYWRVPDADLVVVVLANVDVADADELGRVAVEAAFGAPIEPPTAPTAVALDETVRARAVGHYALTAAGEATLTAAGLPVQVIDSVRSFVISPAPTGVVASAIGQESFIATPIAGDAFYEPREKVTLRFDLTVPGPAAGMTLEQGGLTITYARAP